MCEPRPPPPRLSRQISLCNALDTNERAICPSDPTPNPTDAGRRVDTPRASFSKSSASSNSICGSFRTKDIEVIHAPMSTTRPLSTISAKSEILDNTNSPTDKTDSREPDSETNENDASKKPLAPTSALAKRRSRAFGDEGQFASKHGDIQLPAPTTEAVDLEKNRDAPQIVSPLFKADVDDDPFPDSPVCIQRPKNLQHFPISRLHEWYLAHIFFYVLPFRLHIHGHNLDRKTLSAVRTIALDVLNDTVLKKSELGTFELLSGMDSMRRLRAAVVDVVHPRSLFVSIHSLAAGKPGNEDRAFVVPLASFFGDTAKETLVACVLDGHGGADTAGTCNAMLPNLVAAHLAKSEPEAALRSALHDMQEYLAERYKTTHSPSGTTATMCTIQNNTLSIANLGDSQAIGITSDGRTEILTELHHVGIESERHLVQERGGEVTKTRGVARVDGLCCVTRNLGLLQCKHVGHEPYVVSVPQLAQRFEFVVLASDGLWDVMTPDEVAEVVRTQWGLVDTVPTQPDFLDIVSDDPLCDSGSVQSVSSECASEPSLALNLIQEAVEKGTRDNVSVVVLHIASVEEWMQSQAVQREERAGKTAE